MIIEIQQLWRDPVEKDSDTEQRPFKNLRNYISKQSSLCPQNASMEGLTTIERNQLGQQKDSLD